MAFSHTLELHGDVAVVHCSGRMVAGEFDELRLALLNAIERSGKIVVDLTDTTFIDSTGLGLLAHLCVSARHRSGDVKLAGPSAQIVDVFETTMLGRVFEIYRTTEAAEHAFSVGRGVMKRAMKQTTR